MSKNFEYFNNALNTQSLSTWRALENYIGFNSKVRVYNLPLGYFMNKVEGKFTATVMGNQIFIEFRGEFFNQSATERPQLLPNILLNNINMFTITGTSNSIRLLKSERRVEKIPMSDQIEISHHLILRSITIPPEWTLIEEYDLFNGSYSNSELGTQISTLSNLVSTNSSEIAELKKKSGNSDSGFKADINDIARLILKVKEKSSNQPIIEISVDKEDFEVKFDLVISGNKQEVHITHDNTFEINLPEKLHSSYNSWGLHLYREIISISNCRTKTINNYSQGKSIEFKQEGFNLYYDSIKDFVLSGGYSQDNNGVITEINGGFSKAISNTQTFGLAVTKSQNGNRENVLYVTDNPSTFIVDEEKLLNLDKIKQSPITRSLVYDGTGSLSNLSWYKIGDIVEIVSNNSRFPKVGGLLYNHTNYDNSISTILDTPDNISKVEFLSFYKVFSENLEEVCKIKTINIHDTNDLDVLNPIIKSSEMLYCYGTNLDKEGYPYRISIHPANLLFLFAFRTNLSEWLVTHAYKDTFANDNYSKLPGRITNNTDSKTYLIHNNMYYKYEYDIKTKETKENSHADWTNDTEDNKISKYMIGDTVESLIKGGSLEVYSLEPYKYKNSKLFSIFRSISSKESIISSLINTTTGENLPVQDENYIKLQNARMCCHQTVTWNSSKSIPEVTKVEFITLSEMMKVFITKSTEYLSNHEPVSKTYLEILNKSFELANNLNGTLNDELDRHNKRLEWLREIKAISNAYYTMKNKDISSFKDKFDNASDKNSVVTEVLSYMTSGVLDSVLNTTEYISSYNSGLYLDRFDRDNEENESDLATRFSQINEIFSMNKERVQADSFRFNLIGFDDLKNNILISLLGYNSFSDLINFESKFSREKIEYYESTLNKISERLSKLKNIDKHKQYLNELRNYQYNWGMYL